jgi:hypothetical protein
MGLGADDLAEIGYNAYGEEAEWKTYDGKTMPKWEDLSQPIRNRWMAAAAAIKINAIADHTNEPF